MLDFVLTKPRVGLVHIADNERNVLKRSIVAAEINRNRPALGRQEFREFDESVTQFHADDPHADTEDPFQMFEFWASHLTIGDSLEGEDPRIKVHSAIHVRHGYPDRGHAC